MSDQFFIRTSAGIINREAVSFIAFDKDGSAIVHIDGVLDGPIYLEEPEASRFVNKFPPVTDVREKLTTND